jgi:hypothetical protein
MLNYGSGYVRCFRVDFTKKLVDRVYAEVCAKMGCKKALGTNMVP